MPIRMDSFRLPLFFVIGVRGYYAHQTGTTSDTCPLFTEPILRAWQIPYSLFDLHRTAADLALAYRAARRSTTSPEC